MSTTPPQVKPARTINPFKRCRAPMFHIWSIEHGQWWKPCCCGYTPDRAKAGQYSRAEADDIVAQSKGRHEIMAPVTSPYLSAQAPSNEVFTHGTTLQLLERAAAYVWNSDSESGDKLCAAIRTHLAAMKGTQ